RFRVTRTVRIVPLRKQLLQAGSHLLGNPLRVGGDQTIAVALHPIELGHALQQRSRPIAGDPGSRGDVERGAQQRLAGARRADDEDRSLERVQKPKSAAAALLLLLALLLLGDRRLLALLALLLRRRRSGRGAASTGRRGRGRRAGRLPQLAAVGSGGLGAVVGTEEEGAADVGEFLGVAAVRALQIYVL